MEKIHKDRDDFWDIDKLVPKKKSVMHPFASPKLSVYNVDGVGEKSSEERKLTLSIEDSIADSETQVYIPSDHKLIKKVTIKRSVDKFDFYGNFRKAALVYFDYKTPKCDFVPYYSYMPQYTQLTSEQKAYYFYWRDEVRRGRYIKCDYSYLYLYVYEILNLPDILSPDVGVRLLCSLWKEYRVSLPRIDSYFSVWLQDYCLVHRLACPMDMIRDFIFNVISGVDFKEFYLSEINDAGDSGTEAMMAYLSDYDWRSTRYAADENALIFERHMLGAMGRVIGMLCSQNDKSNSELSVIKRDAFPHSLCTHAVKCKLEIEYLRISRDDEIRRMITMAVRYTENKLRALIGVKSRLGIKDIDGRAKGIIDRYFENIFEIERIRRQRENIPEYEHRYDAERQKLSFAHADEIEMASWETTARLVSESEDEIRDGSDNGEVSSIAYGNNIGKTGAKEFIAERESSDKSYLSDCSSRKEDGYSSAEDICFTSEDCKLLSALLNGVGAKISDEAFERINEAAVCSEIGDVVLEYTENGYALIEDYREEVAALLGTVWK